MIIYYRLEPREFFEGERLALPWRRASSAQVCDFYFEHCGHRLENVSVADISRWFWRQGWFLMKEEA